MLHAKLLSVFDGAIFPDLTLFHSTIGFLQYLSNTRSDLLFAINRVYQFMHRPSTTQWQAVKRILRYLKHTISHGLLLKGSASTRLGAFPMPIGLNVQMIGGPLVAFVFILVTT